jgi:hypothetical protein
MTTMACRRVHPNRGGATMAHVEVDGDRLTVTIQGMDLQAPP